MAFGDGIPELHRSPRDPEMKDIFKLIGSSIEASTAGRAIIVQCLAKDIARIAVDGRPQIVF